MTGIGTWHVVLLFCNLRNLISASYYNSYGSKFESKIVYAKTILNEGEK